MASGRKIQLTRQIGEHLVAAELGRRGLIAAPFAGNVPLFDLLAADESGRSIALQVKAINGPSWQFDVKQFLNIDVVDGVQHVRGKVALPSPDLICIFVFLHDTAGTDEFYIFRMCDLQEHFANTYLGGRRPKNPNATHCAIWPDALQQYKDNWQLVFDVLSSHKG
jgi:hypothetical protein